MFPDLEVDGEHLFFPNECLAENDYAKRFEQSSHLIC